MSPQRPRGSGPTPAPNLVAAPLPDSAQTPKGLQPLTTDVRKAQPGPRGAAPAPQRPPLLRAKACPERDGSAPLGCRLGLAEGRGRKNQRRQPPSRSTAAARWAPTVLKGGQCQGEGRRLGRQSRTSSEAKVWFRSGGFQSRPGPHPSAPGPHPRPQSPPRVAHLRAPGRARRNHGGESGWEARGPGPEKAGSGLEREREGGGLGSASVLPPAPSASIHQPVSPSFLASAPPEAGYRSAKPLAHCGCQAAPEPSTSPEPQPIGALPRGASGPRRAGRPGRCLRRRESRLGGPQPGARWG
ncbi:bcl-2-binding component 3, isoforms 3/4-like [Bos mutus]|uniref:bcl-2-binding component 3, isoforms 3/4-like n=1 Tax=Bos mutus TaxID=72004 RepID=UPI0038B68D47